MNKYKAMIAGVAILAVPALCSAAPVTLTGIDAIGLSSFNSAGLWDNASAPSAGNDYFVPNGTRLRTPADGGSHTFAGDSLTINNTSAYGDGFMYKGTGSAGTVTVGNLIMNGGLISHANGSGDVFNLDGAMSVGAVGARIYAKQGAIHIYSDISGNGLLDNMSPDNSSTSQKLWIHSSANTFSGSIINNGRIEFTDNAVMNFVIGADGVNNNISNGSAGTQLHAIFGGDFVLDLSGASTTIGDSWDLVTTVAASTYWNTSFTVAGFTDQGAGLWTGSANGAEYEFSTDTGTLSVIPEPATLGMIGFVGAGMLFARRRFMI